MWVWDLGLHQRWNDMSLAVLIMELAFWDEKQTNAMMEETDRSE